MADDSSVHIILPEALAPVAAESLGAAGIAAVTETDAERAAADERAIALIGPFRSHDVAEAVEATAPAGLPLIAPVATWAGVTRDDEPGCDDAARHRGTVIRLVARDTVVAQRIAADIRDSGRTAFVVAGEHDYGVQLDGQLRMAGLPRTDDPERADLVVLAGLAGEPEIERAAALGGVPIVAFDGVQGADLGDREVHVALPFGPEAAADGEVRLEPLVRRAADLIAAAVGEGARDRPSLLAALRRLGPFDAHGDPVDPPVWLWRADSGWRLTPDRAL